MRENDADVDIGLKTLNEVEALNSCISKYFKGKSESPPLKKDESLILSALDIYFNGGPCSKKAHGRFSSLNMP